MNIGITLEQNNAPNHKFIQTTGKPLKGAVSEAAKLITNEYTKNKFSLKKWRDEKRLWTVDYEFPPGNKQKSKGFNYISIASFIRENGRFDIGSFNLPELECMWLDHATEMKLNFHMHDNDGQTFAIASGDLQTHYYGSNYPIKPLLKREGHLYTSIQPQLVKRIVKDRKALISQSDLALTDDWVFDLRNLISNSISLLDIAFTQLYIKAQYDPLPSWKFDKKKLGERHGRRLNDKFKWVYQITGNQVNIEEEKESLENLRIIRNHLMHFDPPSLVITLEEVALWLNQILDISKILIKIRQAIGVDISVVIINFMLQEEALFVPSKEGRREPLSSNHMENYYSSTWPES